MSDYKVIKIPQAEFDNLGGDIWWIKQGIASYKKPEWMGNLWAGDGLKKHTRNLEVMIKYRDYSKDIHEKDSLVKFEPIANGEFTLDMLESGKHAVKLRDGMTYLVVGCKLLIVSEKGFYYLHLGNYDNDMLHREVSNIDIVEVFEYPYSPKNLEQYHSIWVRKEEQSNSNELLIEAIDKCIDKLHKNTELLQELSQSHASDLSELNKLLGKNK